MAAIGIDARRRAEQRDRLARTDARREAFDPISLALHLCEKAACVLFPRDLRAGLSVRSGMQVDARRERGAPRVPRLVLLRNAARAIAADEEAIAVGHLP